MSIRRAHVLLPEDLLREIDAFVGPRGRSAFLVETARNEVRRQRLLQLLESDKPIWQDQDHPELAEDASSWVRKLREHSDSRACSAGVNKPSKRTKTK
jgi:hypothetical protein